MESLLLLAVGFLGKLFVGIWRVKACHLWWQIRELNLLGYTLFRAKTPMLRLLLWSVNGA